MNKLIQIILCFVLLQSILFGQNNSIGFQIGVNYAGTKEPLPELYVRQFGPLVDYEEPKYDFSFWGFRLELNKTWELGKRFSFRSGMIFSQKGNKKLIGQFVGGTPVVMNKIERKSTYSFFEFPLLIQYAPFKNGNVDIFIGTSLDLLASSRTRIIIDNIPGRPSVTNDLFHKVNQSLIFGAAYSIMIDNKFNLEFRSSYSHGMLNMIKAENRNTDLLISNLSATIGLQYQL